MPTRPNIGVGLALLRPRLTCTVAADRITRARYGLEFVIPFPVPNAIP